MVDLERLGVKVYRGRADVADEVVLRGVVDELDRDWPPLRGVVHAAGLPGYCPVAEMDRTTLEHMFAAKVAGAWNLHQLTRGRDLDFFICFSSMVSVWGGKGQCHYVAANHFLDVLTHHRRSLGLPSLCVNWGPLTGGGMLPADDASELARLGIATTGLAGAGETLEVLLGADVVQAAAAVIDWRLFKSIYESRRRRPLFDMLGTRPGAGTLAPLAASGEVTRRLQAATEGDRREILAAHVRSVLARVLGLEPTRMPDDRQGFFDMGMDSLTAMDLRANLETGLATPLPSTLAFDYATVETLADYLLTEKLGLGRGLDRSEAGATPDGRETTSEMLERAQARIDELVRAKTEPIAVVGMGCRLPGGVDGPDTYWALLRDGVDAVRETPSDRWDANAFYSPDPGAPGKMCTRLGGFLRERIDQFDPQFFGISPREAESMDPQQRLLLEVAWEALENGAQASERLPASPTGVFIGITSHDYADLQERSDAPLHLGMHSITGSTHNAAAGRLSYCMGFNGPCMAIDTACSSSLVAVHIACRSLLDGECLRALAGGVNLMLSPVATVALSRANVLRPTGVAGRLTRPPRGWSARRVAGSSS